MLNEDHITQLGLAVERGEITHADASRLVRQTIFEGAAAAAAEAKANTPGAIPGAGKPWQSLIKLTLPADRQIVESVLRRQGGSQLDIANGLIQALESNYEEYQQVIKDTKAQMTAQAEAVAEQEWLRTTDDGKTEFERRTLAESQAILQTKAEAKTRADAARVILEEKHNLGDVSASRTKRRPRPSSAPATEVSSNDDDQRRPARGAAKAGRA